MEKHDISGKIILLGTPGQPLYSLYRRDKLLIKILFLAEEGGGGKVILLNNGAYKEMDICLMYAVYYLLLCVKYD